MSMTWTSRQDSKDLQQLKAILADVLKVIEGNTFATNSPEWIVIERAQNFLRHLNR